MNNFKMISALSGVVALSMATSFVSAQATLTTGVGDANVTVTVDGYGSFGSSTGSSTTTSNAIYDPIGAQAPAGTTFQSAIAFRGNTTSGARTYLSNGGSFGNASPGQVLASSAGTTSANSTFSFGGLSWALNQRVDPLFLNSGVTRAGAFLTQTYTITNPGNVTANFEIVRYIDGDLLFDGTLTDSGGRIVSGGREYLFETDSGSNPATASELVAITGEGGTIPAAGRYQILNFSTLRGNIGSGSALTDTILNDNNADGFIDTPYDVTLGLRNLYTLAPNTTATYVATTYFGSFAPSNIPEPTLGLGLAGLAGLALRRRRA